MALKAWEEALEAQLTRKLRLIDVDGIRRNNFTPIRITLAWLVLYGHSYAIQNASGLIDPLNSLFKDSIWVGALAVNGFFVISGFLVSASITRRGVRDYLLSRILRIYPALICCVLLSALLVGPICSIHPPLEYFSKDETYLYLQNMLGFFTMRQFVPGVFLSNIKQGLNGSLWSLQIEIWCYLILAAIFLGGGLGNRLRTNLTFLVIFLAGILWLGKLPLLGGNTKWVRPAGYFLIGMFFYYNRAQIILDRRFSVLAAGIVAFSFGTCWYSYVFPFLFAYLLLALAYLTPYWNLEAIGDISYGIYIYAWPSQQVIASLFPHHGPLFNTGLATIIVIMLATLSWHLVERPCLAMKRRWLRSESVMANSDHK